MGGSTVDRQSGGVDGHGDMIKPTWTGRGSPAGRLFFAPVALIEFLSDHTGQLRCAVACFELLARTEVTAEHLRSLEDACRKIFSETDVLGLFPEDTIDRVRSHLKDDAYDVILGPGGALRFQVALAGLGLCRDFLGACDLYEVHRESFVKNYPKMASRSDFTGRVNWKVTAESFSELLRAEFADRYVRDEGTFRYDSKLHNEALSIAVLTARSFAAVQTSGPESTGGGEFERKCAGRLEALGYSSRVTKGSGDFGADVIARRSGISFAIQCKCHGGPVGVAAVQEAVSGQKHYVADYAVVISNMGFTRAAKELAASARVILVGIDGLEDLEVLARNLDRGDV